jgi:carboxymethylenebutenolidase
MGETIQFKRPDGKNASGYLSMTKGGMAAPCVVVIQEWWGVNEQIKGIADRLTSSGYTALVPDLYQGQVATTEDEANHLVTELNWGDAAAQDVRGAVLHLKAKSKKVAVLGFCVGGALTIIAAVKVPEVDAAACFYGIPPDDAADPTKIRVPFLAHFAKDDDWCNPEAVDRLEAKLKEGRVAYELHRYDAKHAFMNEKRPKYDAGAAKLAWDRTIAFLRKNLA